MSSSLLNRLEPSVVLVYVEYSIDWTISRPLTAIDRHEETLLASRRQHSVIGSTKLPYFYDRSPKVHLKWSCSSPFLSSINTHLEQDTYRWTVLY